MPNTLTIDGVLQFGLEHGGQCHKEFTLRVATLEDVEVVISPDHRAFSHTNPLRGLVAGGTFILQSSATPEEVWQELPAQALQGFAGVFTRKCRQHKRWQL